MKKNIIIIAGSPRPHGNSDLLAERFAEGALSAGHHVEIIYIRKLNLNYCMGCYNCVNKGVCIYKDSMSNILDKMLNADVIAFSSPVYYYSISGQMKVFLDRTLPIYEHLENKDLYYMLTAEDDNRAQLNRAMDALQGWADCFQGMTVRGRIYGGNSYEKGEVCRTPAWDKALELGASI